MDVVQDEQGQRKAGASEDPIFLRAKRCLRRVSDVESPQRQREIEDLRFQVPEYQWDDDAISQRRGNNSTGTAVSPARPTLSISKLDQPIQLVLNQARAARLGVNVHPVSEKADDDTAEVMQGIYRRIERDSNANQARGWALQRAVVAGRGVYRITTKWDEDADPDTFDQEICIERILHQEMVYFDPSAQKPDYSDGEWAIIAAWMPVSTFKREYPDAEVPTADTLEGMDEQVPDWIMSDETGEDGEDAVLVGEFIYKHHKPETITVKGKERTRDIVSIKSCHFSGVGLLREEELNGRYIPLVPVFGRELIPFDGERRWVGMVRPARDAQKFFNYAASSLVESMALEPRAPYIGVEGQFEGHTDKWNQINTRNFPYVEFRSVDLEGKPAPAPQRMQVDSSKMQLAMMAMQQADPWIQATTAVHDPSLGRQNPNEKSGRAILALQSQSDAGTSHYLASLADVSLAYEARVILDLIPAIYDRPGRITRILGGEDETKTVMLNAPFVMDQSGRPVPGKGKPEAKTYNLADGKYSLSTSIGKSFQTRLQEGGEMLGEILQAHPDLVPLIGPTYFEFQDWPGHKEVADILRKIRDQKYPGLTDDDENSPQALQAKVQALTGQAQQMSQQLQQAVQYVKTEQAKHQAAIQIEKLKQEANTFIEKMKADRDLALQQMKDATAIEVAQINLRGKGIQAETAQRNEEIALALSHGHESREANEQRAHEVAMRAVEHGHAMQAAEVAGVRDMAAQEQGQAHEAGLQQSSQEAAMEQQQLAQEAAERQAAMAAEQQEAGE